MTEIHVNTVEAFNRPVAGATSTLTAAAKRDAIRKRLLEYLPDTPLIKADAASFLGFATTAWRKPSEGRNGPAKISAKKGRGARALYWRDDYVAFLMRCMEVDGDPKVRAT